MYSSVGARSVTLLPTEQGRSPRTSLGLSATFAARIIAGACRANQSRHDQIGGIQQQVLRRAYQRVEHVELHNFPYRPNLSTRTLEKFS